MGTVSATGEGGDTVGYSLSGTGNANFAISSSGAIAVASGATLSSTSYSLTVIAKDNQNSDTSTASVTIAIQPPLVLTVNAGLTVNLGGSATIGTSVLKLTDADRTDSQVIFTVVSAPWHGTLSDNGTALSAGSTFTEADFDNSLLSYQNTDTSATADSFSFQVSDGAGGAIPTTTFAITLGTINHAPSFTAGANQTVLENSSAQTVSNWATNLSAGPPSESSQLLNFIVANNNNSLFAVQPAIDASGNLTYTPAANMTGTATVTVKIHDNGGTANGGVDTSAAQTFTILVNQMVLTGTTLTTAGSSQGDNLSVTVLPGGGGLVVTLDGNSQTFGMPNVHKFVFDGQDGAFSKVVFDDSSNSYSVTQTLDGVQLVGNGFEFDTEDAANVYVYGNSNSTATVNVTNGTGNNFFVDAVNGGYSYIADPISGTYSELSGFGSVTVTGEIGGTYAYIYSTSNAKVVGSPNQTTFTVGGLTSTLNNFPQVYVVGASDGTDSVTLNSSGGSFVSTPTFSYVSGTANGSSFLVGALFSANVIAQASTTTDTAVFYSYPNDTFNGASGQLTDGEDDQRQWIERHLCQPGQWLQFALRVRVGER